MKRPFLLIVVLAIAAVPILNDVCALDCAVKDAQECPLHQPAPDPCGHDHLTGETGLVREAAASPKLVVLTLAAPAPRATATTARPATARLERPHDSAPRSSRPDVLRI
jgi:hypothetical protein